MNMPHPFPPDEDDERAELLRQVAGLESRRADLLARFPAHSISPNLIAALDDLDEALAALHRRLSGLDNTPPVDYFTNP